MLSAMTEEEQTQAQDEQILRDNPELAAQIDRSLTDPSVRTRRPRPVIKED